MARIQDWNSLSLPQFQINSPPNNEKDGKRRDSHGQKDGKGHKEISEVIGFRGIPITG